MPPPYLTLDDVRPLYAGSDGAHGLDHVLRVTRLAVRIARAEAADVEVVRVAAWLHDVAEERDDHHLAAARVARDLLARARAPSAFIEAVAHSIEAHRFSHPPEPRTLEAQCLSDADKLDAIGAVGVARAFLFAGVHGNRMWTHPLDTLADLIGPDPRAYRRAHAGQQDYTPSHELLCKLAGLAQTMYTATARSLAQERHAFMMAFFRRLDEEALGER